MTKEERSAINSLERLAKRWPKTLGLFSWSGSLTVIRLDEKGEFPLECREYMHKAIVCDISGIKNDGGCP